MQNSKPQNCFIAIPNKVNFYNTYINPFTIGYLQSVKYIGRKAGIFTQCQITYCACR